MKPICVPCQRFFRPRKNGFFFIEAIPTCEGALPGTVHKDHWKPYKLWVGDKWICEGCAAEIVVGTALHPVAEHYQSDFADKVRIIKPTLQVNDC